MLYLFNFFLLPMSFKRLVGNEQKTLGYFCCVCQWKGECAGECARAYILVLFQGRLPRVPTTHTHKGRKTVVPTWSRMMERVTRCWKSTSRSNSIYREKHCRGSHLYFRWPNRWLIFLGTSCSHWEPSRFCSYFTYARHIPFYGLWVIQNTFFSLAGLSEKRFILAVSYCG